MQHSVTMSDEEFLGAFLECRLPAAAFDHRGHVRVAWLLLKRHPLERAIEEICSGIARFAAHLGARAKYNRTLSEALVRLMAQGGSSANTFEDFVNANTQLLTNAGDLLARHYSAELLHSPAAKVSFVPPDRLPLPTCRA